MRAKEDDDQWVGVDPNLEDSSEGLSPAAVPFSVEYGDGGSKDLATVTSPTGTTLSLDWQSKLPAGSVEDNQISYSPTGVDDGELVVTSQREGFNFSVVLDQAPAAGAVPEYRFPLTLSAGRFVVRPDGTIDVKSEGNLVGSISPPVMWDSSDEPKTAPVKATLEGTGTDRVLVLRPDPAYLADPERTYPVTVDPTVSLTATGDTWVQSFLTTNSQYTSTELLVGTNSLGLNAMRSYLNFDTTTLGNAQPDSIVDAKVSLSNFESGSCSGQAIRLSQVTSAWSVAGVSWASQPSTTDTGSTTTDLAHGTTGCTAEERVEFDAKAIVKAWAGGATNHGLQLRADNPGVNASFRRYRSLENGDNAKAPKLTVTVSQPPATPTNFAATPGQYGNFITSKTPSLSAVVTDPDGGQAKGYFEIKQGTTLIWSGSSALVSVGGTASVDVPAGKLNEAGDYVLSVWAEDPLGVRSATPATKTVKVDTTAPTVTASSPQFSNGAWTVTPPASATINLDGTTDTGGFWYDLNDVRYAVGADSTGDASVPLYVTPGWHSVVITPMDRAGNTGAPVTFSYGTGSGGFTTPNQWTPSAASFPVNFAGPASATGATLQWRVYGESTWRTAAKVKKFDGSAWTGTVDGIGRSTTGDLVWTATDESYGTGTLGVPALIEARGCFQYSSSSDSCTSSLYLPLIESAFGKGFPTADLGPASVALVTGETLVSETDTVDSKVGLARSFSSYSDSTLASGLFGPGWSDPELLAPQGDSAAKVIDNRAIDGTFVIVGFDGGSQIFKPTATNGNTFKPLEPTGDATILSVISGSPDRLQLSVPINNGVVDTIWEWRASDTGADPDWTLVGTDAPGTRNDLSVTNVGQRPTFIRESDPTAAATCTQGTQTDGCRALKITYVGTGTSTRLSKIERVVGASTPAAVSVKTLATYTYDDGKLAKVCGPTPNAADPALCTEYTYTTAAGRTMLATLQPSGLTAWRLAYDSIGRLLNVKRARPASSGGGDATWSVDYNLSTTASGLPDMSPGKVSEWGQQIAPAKVYAVYPPVTGSAGVEKAHLYYTDHNGVTTNTASRGPAGWLVDTNWYDARGNITQHLDAAGWARVQAAPAAERSRVAAEASSYRVFNNWGGPDLAGTRLVDEYGPAVMATTGNGTTGYYRSHTSTTYDDDPNVDPALVADRPDAVGRGLIVKKTASTATVDLSVDHDPKVTKYGYAPVVTGDGNGWDLGLPTTVSNKTGPSTWSTSVTRYSASGRLIETRQPGGGTDSAGAGNDARATVTTYYTGSGTGECSGDPEWAGLPCKTGPASQPAGESIPTKWFVEYDAELRPALVKDIAGGAVVRTTTTTYDDLGRETSTSISTSGSSTGTDTVTTSNGYDPSSGLQTTITAGSTGGGTITTSYDEWGRRLGYTDASGLTSGVTYDAENRVASLTGQTAATFTYSSQGMLESADVSAGGIEVGSYNYSYNNDGSLAAIEHPNGLTANMSDGTSGSSAGLTYSNGSGAPLLAFTSVRDVEGRVLQQASPGSAQSFSYDGLGRLERVEDTRLGQCTTRSYQFNDSSDRTSAKSYGPTSTGACQNTTAASVRTTAYDTAHRITNSGYTYDKLGRTRTMPVADTSSDAAGPLAVDYRASDLVKELTQSVVVAGVTKSKSMSYSLDPAGRIGTITTKLDGTETQRLRYRYRDESDAPALVETSTDGGATWSAVRYTSAPGAGMSAQITSGNVTYQVANAHGDIVATTDAAGSIQSYGESDEFGNQAGGNPQARYGWLGASQRSTDAVGGMMLMGVRLYNSRVGAFLTMDPMRGANATPYAYPQDPINNSDTNGMAPAACEAKDRQDPYANCERMWEACRDYTSHARCLYLFYMLDYLTDYVREVARNPDSNTANAGRHFGMVISAVIYVGYSAAKKIAAAHEYGTSRIRPLDNRRDVLNNDYALGWFTRHSSWARDFVGGHVTKGDMRNLYWHGVSLYNRGYMYGICRDRYKTRYVFRGPCQAGNVYT